MKGGSLSVLFTLATILLILFVAIPQSGSAYPYRIKGYLKDDTGNPISGADLQIRGQVYNMTSQAFEYQTTSFLDATDPAGFYNINIGLDEPGGVVNGSTVTIFYNDGNTDATTSHVIIGNESSNSPAWINLTAITAEENDDYTYTFLIVVVIIVVFVLVIAIIRYRDSSKEEEETKEEAKVGRRRK